MSFAVPGLGSYRLRCSGSSLFRSGARAAESPGLVYFNVSDGTSIAVNIQFPAGEPPEGGWPTVIQIDGYDGATGPDSPGRYGDRYATAHMSLRGTGCSGGSFNLFDRRSSRDGREVIEWLAEQSWSNGDVAIWGHSYSGLTGWLTASTFAEPGVKQPIPLKAISVSGLIDDLYRGIVYMGGVSNLGFPLIWTGAFRPAVDVGTGSAPGVLAGDQQCITNIATRPPDPQAALDNAILNGAAKLDDSTDPWWTTRATITYLPDLAGLQVPIHIVQSYQDEQTGPRGSNLLWQKLDEYRVAHELNLPLRLVLTNGVHSTNTTSLIQQDRTRWFDRFVLGEANGIDAAPRVKVWFETHNNGTTLVPTGTIESNNWPLEQTDWQRWYLGEGTVSPTAPTAKRASDPFVAGTKRTSALVFYAPGVGGELTTASGPDNLRYLSEPFATNTAIAGPIDSTLYVSSTAPDTELYVELSDVFPDGTEMRLQRGMLKASHRDYIAGEVRLQLERRPRPALPEEQEHAPQHPHARAADQARGRDLPGRSRVPARPPPARPGHEPARVDSLNVYVPSTPPAVDQVYPGHEASVLDPAAVRPGRR